MENKLDRIEGKISSIDMSISEIKTDLKYHIKRTDLLEIEIKPLKEKYLQLEGVMKFMAAVFAIVAFVECLIKIKYH